MFGAANVHSCHVSRKKGVGRLCGLNLSVIGGMKMKRHAQKRPFIEIDIVSIKRDEQEASRKHIKAEGFFPSLFVAVYSVLVLGTFGKIGDLFRAGIKLLIGKLSKHNYCFYEFPEMLSVWCEFSL